MIYVIRRGQEVQIPGTYVSVEENVADRVSKITLEKGDLIPDYMPDSLYRLIFE